MASLIEVARTMSDEVAAEQRQKNDAKLAAIRHAQVLEADLNEFISHEASNMSVTRAEEIIAVDSRTGAAFLIKALSGGGFLWKSNQTDMGLNIHFGLGEGVQIEGELLQRQFINWFRQNS